MNKSLEDQLKALNHSPASEPNPRWVASLRSKFEWTMARGAAPVATGRDLSLQHRQYRVWFRRPFAVAALSLAFLLAVGSGVTYAAQSALPGQTLYPVKLASEEVRIKLAANDTARMEVELTLADRRVGEFRVLSSQSTLTPETAAAITTRYETHIAAALATLPSLPQEAIEGLTASLADTMDAHIKFTTSLEQENSPGKEEHDEDEEESNARDNEGYDASMQRLEEARARLNQRKEEIRKQVARMREFARESSRAAQQFKKFRGNTDIQYEMKIETDERGNTHVKVETQQKKDEKEQSGNRELIIPANTATVTEIAIPPFNNDEDDEEDNNNDTPTDTGMRATTTIRIKASPAIPPLPASTPSSLRDRFLRIFNPGVQFNFRSRTEGSGSVEQHITTGIQSSSRVEIKSNSNSRRNNEDDE